MTTDLSKADEESLSRLEALSYGSTLDVAAFLDDADVIAGRKLLGKPALIGVPIGITSITFRAGIGGRDYVSVEATDLRARVDVVVNDGSTGIRRQCVEYLTAKGQLSKAKDPDAALPDELHGQPFPVKWAVLQGLRVSEYDNGNGDSETWYLAV